jgi:adenylate cyclase
MDIQFGQYRLRRADRLLLGPEGPVGLSARSFDILTTLLAHPEAVVGKTQLFDAVWPGMVVEDNTLQVHMSALRKALAPGMIVTVHGRGYKYAGPRPAEIDAGNQVAPATPGDLKPPTAVHKPVIAVLPFRNMSDDADQTYFSDGITEDIIVELSRYRPLNVVSRHSSSHFGGNAIDLEDAARQLGAQYLVEGSVRRMGGRVRITAQLLETETSSHVWAERYDQDLTELFAIQDELVRKIVSTIAGHVERHTDGRARTKLTERMDAYDCWLRANHGQVLWTLDGNMACRQLLEEAIKRDPLFARAHASLAFCHIRTAMMSPGLPEIPALEREAVEHAERAIRLDAAEARAHNALGWSQMYFREFDRARSAFMNSAALNPNDGAASVDRALALALLGEQDAADETARVAAILNPLGGEWYASVRAYVHFMAKRYEAAEAFFALSSRDSPDVMAWHAANLAYLGRMQEAAGLMRNALQRLGTQWRGPAPMQPEDFLRWYHHNNMFRLREGWDHLFGGLLKAGFPPVADSHLTG